MTESITLFLSMCDSLFAKRKKIAHKLNCKAVNKSGRYDEFSEWQMFLNEKKNNINSAILQPRFITYAYKKKLYISI